MGRLLFVVARQRPELYESLRQHCAEVDDVEVILDRRNGERRRRAGLTAEERRRAERRSHRVEQQLASVGFALVSGGRAARAVAAASVSPLTSNPAALAPILQTFSLFKTFTLPQLVALAERVRPQTLRKGETLFREGDPGGEMYFVERGRLVISKAVKAKVEKVLAFMGPGDFFGEMSLFGRAQRSASVRAESDASLLILDRRGLEQVIEMSPQAGLDLFTAMVREFSERLEHTDDLVAEVTRWGLEATGLDTLP